MTGNSLRGLLTATDRDAFLAELAAGGPISRGTHLDGSPIWLVTGHAESLTVLTDPRFSSDPAKQTGFDLAAAAGLPEDVAPYLLRTLGAYDPPDHTRLRRLVSRAFTHRRIEQLRPRIQQIADGLLDGLPDEFDLIERYAYPLPIQVICELLGVPLQDRDTWRAWAGDLSAPDPARIATGARALVAYMADLIARMQAGDQAGQAENLLSALIATRDEDGGRLSEQELIALSVSILIAGHETTVSLIGRSVHLILSRRLSLAGLTDAGAETGAGTGAEAGGDVSGDVSGDVGAAVEEFLRYGGPAEIAVLRYALQPVQLGGVTIGAGEAVQVVYAAANRDPARFDRPDALDPRRADNPHLGFGHGIHYCLGAALARAETQIALTTLLRRYPALELAVLADGLAWKPGLQRALAALPVRTGPAHPS
ncbi:cytochrome P450 [Nonomuraea phyllanthi]|uniref:cytochrome P450 family protein n=1 Tax=Nonomuraea phyllanthi TaxID=2219224 RepID=UPI001292DB0F|nr:cytochrome P450 [Nonomuraea phyllanthi]QFY10015.1 cytochrome P450 [Nonomuraea phyllanthi]